MSGKNLWVVLAAFILAVLVVAGYFILFGEREAAPVFSSESPMPSPTLSSTASPTPTATPKPPPEFRVLEASRQAYLTGVDFFEQQEYAQAKASFMKVNPEDTENYAAAQEKLAQCNRAILEDSLLKAREAMDKTHYIKAQTILSDALKELPDNPELTVALNEAEDILNNPVLYEGPIYHVFFHSLIVYPELCFTGDAMTQGYNAWMTTVYEFKLMIQEMYDRGYILVDLAKLFGKDESGKTVVNPLYLSKGKIPLVISIDDVSYYEYMKDDGFAKRLVLDEKGEVATLVETPEGEEIITRDGDVMPILDDFVKENPDFSLNNAKGTLALTGYEGMLGYNVRKVNPDWEKEAAEAKKIVEIMKANGWSFANHSYTHRSTFKDRTITLDYLSYDCRKWKEEIGSIVGETHIFISPFGAQFPDKDARLDYIIDQGFYVYCGVGSRAYYTNKGNYVFMERINLDGFKMTKSPKVLEPFFDVEKVYDPVRPPANY